MCQAVQNAPGARFRANVSMTAGNHVFHFLRRIGRAAPECLRQVPHGVQIIVPVAENGDMGRRNAEPGGNKGKGCSLIVITVAETQVGTCPLRDNFLIRTNRILNDAGNFIQAAGIIHHQGKSVIVLPAKSQPGNRLSSWPINDSSMPP